MTTARYAIFREGMDEAYYHTDPFDFEAALLSNRSLLTTSEVAWIRDLV